MNDDVFVKFDYGALDMARGTRLRVARGPGAGTALAAGVAVAGVAVVLVAIVVVPTAPDWARALAGWLLVLASVHAAFTVLKAAPHAMFRASSGERGPVARGDLWNRKMSVDASEEGIIVTVGQRSASLKWRDCVRLDSDPSAHVLYHGELGFLVVPRRAFRSEAQDTAFRELCRSFLDSQSSTSAPPEGRSPGWSVEPSTAEAPPVVAGSPPAAQPRVGRNAPCPCGSGKKHKRCCLGSTA